MQVRLVPAHDEAQCQELESFLVERIDEFNSSTTGYFDGKLLAGAVRNEQGAVIAGFSGHTWGACCEFSHVGVHERHSGHGVEKALIAPAEAEACRRGCVQLVLTTHSFQAPGFYERMGYERMYTLEGRPQGHAQLIYSKRLRVAGSS